MMKYINNHPQEFSAPILAFWISFLQFFTGFATELCCMIFLSSLDNAIDVIIRFIALGSIAKVDNFFADALSSCSSFKLPIKGFKATHCTRDTSKDASQAKKDQCKNNGHRHCGFLFILYKMVRLFYICFVFYFMPYISIFLPFLATFYV